MTGHFALASNSPVSSSLPSGGTTGGPNGLGLSRPEQASIASRIASPFQPAAGEVPQQAVLRVVSQARGPSATLAIR